MPRDYVQEARRRVGSRSDRIGPIIVRLAAEHADADRFNPDRPPDLPVQAADRLKHPELAPPGKQVYYVLFPTPKERVLEMTAPSRFKATLEAALK